MEWPGQWSGCRIHKYPASNDVEIQEVEVKFQILLKICK